MKGRSDHIFAPVFCRKPEECKSCLGQDIIKKQIRTGKQTIGMCCWCIEASAVDGVYFVISRCHSCFVYYRIATLHGLSVEHRAATSFAAMFPLRWHLPIFAGVAWLWMELGLWFNLQDALSLGRTSQGNSSRFNWHGLDRACPLLKKLWGAVWTPFRSAFCKRLYLLRAVLVAEC